VTCIVYEHKYNALSFDISCKEGCFFFSFVRLLGTVATPGLLCQPRVIVKMIVEKQMECRLAGESEVL
jgi:hypothetical protein